MTFLLRLTQSILTLWLCQIFPDIPYVFPVVMAFIYLSMAYQQHAHESYPREL